jgi:hypothetical protein
LSQICGRSARGWTCHKPAKTKASWIDGGSASFSSPGTATPQQRLRLPELRVREMTGDVGRPAMVRAAREGGARGLLVNRDV